LSSPEQTGLLCSRPYRIWILDEAGEGNGRATPACRAVPVRPVADSVEVKRRRRRRLRLLVVAKKSWIGSDFFTERQEDRKLSGG
jgi:hypothetical protein